MAAVSVLLFHLPGFWRGLFGHAYLAVDLFFLISGVVIAYAYEPRLSMGWSPVEFIAERIRRLAPLYFLAVFLAIFSAFLLIRLGHPQSYLALKLALAILFIPVLIGNSPLYPLNPPCWTLLAEILVNLGFAAAARQVQERGLILLIFVCFLLLCWAVVRSPQAADLGTTAPSWAGGLARAGFSFPLGVLLCRLHREGRLAQLRVRPWLLIAAVAASFSLPLATRFYDLAMIGLFYPGVIVLALANEPESPMVDRLFGLAGFISYPLYVLHWPMLQVVLKLTPGDGLTVVGLLFALCCLLMAYFAGRSFDVPLQAWLRRVSTRSVSGAIFAALPATIKEPD